MLVPTGPGWATPSGHQAMKGSRSVCFFDRLFRWSFNVLELSFIPCVDSALICVSLGHVGLHCYLNTCAQSFIIMTLIFVLSSRQREREAFCLQQPVVVSTQAWGDLG